MKELTLLAPVRTGVCFVRQPCLRADTHRQASGVMPDASSVTMVVVTR